VNDEVSEHPPQPPPAPPRALTPSARRRSWAEPRVRNWWLMAVAMLLVGLFFTATRLVPSLRDYSLMKSGVRVEASIIDAQGGNTLKKLYDPEQRVAFHMTYHLPDGSYHEINEPLKNQRKSLGPGMKIPLYVDPKDPSHWTDRVEISWLEDTMIALLLLPTVLLFLAIAAFNRFSVLRAWTTGHAIHASVVEMKQSASAPRSSILRFVLGHYHDQRIFSTLIPNRRAKYQPGDVVWVIIPSTTPRWAILAELYE
jgi:hypothetical protein